MKPVQRIQQNMLATAERRLLNWLCARLPSWIMPDHLTAIGFVGSLIVSTGYALSTWNPAWLFVSVAAYFVNWFGDSLDGSLARFRKTERPGYGYMVDHSADSLANALLGVGLGCSPYMRMDVALFAIIGYLLMSIHTFIASKVMGEFRLSYMAGGPTELRIMLIIMSLTMFALGPKPSFLPGFTVFDVFALLLGLVLISLFIVQTLGAAKLLASREK
jgi:archaetidylinositol phosphate synthase